MKRLFAAIEIPDDIRDMLADLEAPLPGARWVEMDDMHLTLRFFGEIDGRTSRDLSDLLAGIDVFPFEIQLKGIDAFGGREPRAIYAAVAISDPLERLQRAVDRAAMASGLPPEPRKFTPHVTLARLRNGRDTTIARYLQRHAAFSSPPFVVDRFAVFSAKSGGGGPYVIEEEFLFSDVSYSDPD
jgi:2'-5' RNA ligase